SAPNVPPAILLRCCFAGRLLQISRGQRAKEHFTTELPGQRRDSAVRHTRDMGHRFRNWSIFFAGFLALVAAGWLVYGYVSNPGLRSPRAARLDASPEAGAAASGTSGNALTTERATRERAKDASETGSPLPDKEILEYTGHVSKLSNVAALSVMADQAEF